MRLTKLFGLFVFSAILVLGFASCSSSDKEDDHFLDNSSVVGNWDFEKADYTFTFSEAFSKDKSEEELKEYTALVEKFMATESAKDKLTLKDSKLKLLKDFTFEFQILNEENKPETGEGIYVLDPTLKAITFAVTVENNLKFELNGTEMSNERIVSSTDVATGTGEDSGIKSEDIKSASVVRTYIKISK